MYSGCISLHGKYIYIYTFLPSELLNEWFINLNMNKILHATPIFVMRMRGGFWILVPEKVRPQRLHIRLAYDFWATATFDTFYTHPLYIEYLSTYFISYRKIVRNFIEIYWEKSQFLLEYRFHPIPINLIAFTL